MDVYLKLSDNKYIKIHREGDYLDNTDSEHFKNKGVENLFVAKEDLPTLVDQYDEFLTEKLKISRFKETQDEQSFLSDITSSSVNLASALGLTQETYEICKKTVDLVYRVLAEDKNYETLFKIRESDSEYAKHVMNLSMFLCLCSAKLGWSYEGTFKKFILAAFIHDSDLGLEIYKNLEKYENPDGTLTEEGKKPEYRNHPARAAQISPYSSLFIFCEAMLRTHKMGEIKKNDLMKFVANNPQFVEKGALKKMIQQLLKDD